jgi:four helix bundle protein
MEKATKTYRDLKVWQLGIELVKDIYRLSDKLPQQELYGLKSQMRRSAVSIPSNVAEGFRRFHNREYAQFLRISLGSCAELETLITIAKELRYIIRPDEETEFLEKLNRESGMIMNLMKKVIAKTN